MKPCLADLPPDQWPIGDAPLFHRRQLANWIFQRGARTFSQMSDLPAEMRAELEKQFALPQFEALRVQGSADTTRKFLWKLHDGALVESVLIPASESSEGVRAGRLTLCISTQVGCAYGCRFCASGLDGWKRNLTPGEIVGQVLSAQREAGARIQNLVFMGMGEPLANFRHLLDSLDCIGSEWGLGIGARHITISTSGLVPQIEALAQDPRQIRLAISLHAPTDQVRNQIMPINRKYPLAELMRACEIYQKKKGRLITFEYILLDGINDDPALAPPLAALCRRAHAKLNLIPYNTVEGLPWQRPSPERIEAFSQALRRAGAQATLRHEKGSDIDAACGQLRLRSIQSQPGHD